MNKGFKCERCGIIPAAASKNKRNVCPTCSHPVTEWTRPLNERPGRCSNCSCGSFKLAMGNGKLKGTLLAKCKECDQVTNPDTGEILKEGRKL